MKERTRLQNFHSWKFKNYPKLKLSDWQKECIKMYLDGGSRYFATMTPKTEKSTFVTLLTGYFAHEKIINILGE